MNEITSPQSVFNKYAINGICQALINFNPENKKPIFICIGSDLVLGDSLGPLTGTFLRKKGIRSFVYGTLNFPITSREVEYARTYIKQMHPNSISIAIDAAVGESNDIGLIRTINKGLKPGLGVDKNLGTIGDVSIIGIVAEKSLKNYSLFNLTRLNLIYKMADVISKGIEEYISYLQAQTDNIDRKTFGA